MFYETVNEGFAVIIFSKGYRLGRRHVFITQKYLSREQHIVCDQRSQSVVYDQ